MILLYFALFLGAALLLYFASSWIIRGLDGMAKFLGWKEFVVALIVMASAASLSNLFFGISAALHKVPELSFGDVVGGNVIDLTLVIGLSALIAKGGISAESRTVQATAIFTLLSAVAGLFLISDGILSRGDALVLFFIFGLYIYWLFSVRERFKGVYDSQPQAPPTRKFKKFLLNIASVLVGISIMLVAAETMVRSTQYIGGYFNIPLSILGIFLVAFGNALPETYFSVVSARKGETWLTLGDLMGAVIIPATLVLGVVALIKPIVIEDFSPFAIARFFLILSALFFLFFVRTEKKIDKREALFLFLLYVLFVAAEIFWPL